MWVCLKKDVTLFLMLKDVLTSILQNKLSLICKTNKHENTPIGNASLHSHQTVPSGSSILMGLYVCYLVIWIDFNARTYRTKLYAMLFSCTFIWIILEETLRICLKQLRQGVQAWAICTAMIKNAIVLLKVIYKTVNIWLFCIISQKSVSANSCSEVSLALCRYNT